MEEKIMRFVRCLAAMAAFVCSTVAGQAWASGRGTTIIHLQSDPAQTPLSSLYLQIGYGGLYGIKGLFYPFNLGHWVAGSTIDPRFRISSIYGSTTAQADTLTLRLFKYKAPLSERISYFNFDFAPGSLASIGTFQSIGALNATMTVDYIAQPAVPEPATWALLILGFGATGQVLRTRRRRAAPITA
ncbi:PEPxxWA-CTERM sorting domain-containing protein [Sphingobium fluviale]|uniref:PEP-CTERM sorting domain-containing protein n=1 Tax=Sphingobium fluviale TaxID=2506423 RepID=A0A4Q1KIL1_9SPHN|nr:PEPxxWA-CTERM sorting domain-containing protein [Sphingobium fluviale]RXR28969.1 PEP-CTERM sorting domain-containing protein [Sphingobium fluviale]